MWDEGRKGRCPVRQANRSRCTTNPTVMCLWCPTQDVGRHAATNDFGEQTAETTHTKTCGSDRKSNGHVESRYR